MKPSLKTCTIFFIKPLSLFPNFNYRSKCHRNSNPFSLISQQHRQHQHGPYIQLSRNPPSDNKRWTSCSGSERIPNFPFCSHGANLSVFNSWCQIARFQLLVPNCPEPNCPILNCPVPNCLVPNCPVPNCPTTLQRGERRYPQFSRLF